MQTKRNTMAKVAAEILEFEGVDTEPELLAALVKHEWREVRVNEDPRAVRRATLFRNCALPEYAIGVTHRGMVAHTPEHPASDITKKTVTSLIVPDKDYTAADFWDRLDAQRLAHYGGRTYHIDEHGNEVWSRPPKNEVGMSAVAEVEPLVAEDEVQDEVQDEVADGADQVPDLDDFDDDLATLPFEVEEELAVA